MFSESWRT